MLSLSWPTRAQWLSIAKNVLLTAISAALGALQGGTTDWKVLITIITMAVLKTAEKLLTEPTLG